MEFYWSFVLVNAWTFGCFWYDKTQAIAGKRRMPEATLLALSAFGGSPGALLGRQLFRHKTRKEPFSTILHVIVMAQVGLIIGFVIL